MNELREKMAQALLDLEVSRDGGASCDILNAGEHTRCKHLSRADAIIAALPGMVMPLEWEDHPLNGEPVLSRALVKGGGYFICDDTDDFTGAYLDFVSCDDVRWWQHVRSTSQQLVGNHRDDDIEPLKAAAQAHYAGQVVEAFGVAS